MFSLIIIVTSVLILCANSCSIALPMDGTYYISNAQLLLDIDYPDSILLTIRKTTNFNPLPPIQPLPTIGPLPTIQPLPIPPMSPISPSLLVLPRPIINNGPWCKIMNVNTGSVGNVLPCSVYTNKIRNYASPDPITTKVSCSDNCDGSAKCMITKNSITRTIDNIRYLASGTNCNINTPKIGGIATSFTIIKNNIETTYISFSTNMVGIEWNDNVSPVSYTIYDVDREGDWSVLTPGTWFGGMSGPPSVYSDINIIRVSLPCCLCYSYRLIAYTITINPIDQSQIFILKELGWGGGQVDALKSRVINWGLFYSDTITVYDLSSTGSVVVNTFKPNLCNFMAQCAVEPCSDPSLKCPYNPTARCVNDYCGGCNVRWFCGSRDITNQCNLGAVSAQICPAVN